MDVTEKFCVSTLELPVSFHKILFDIKTVFTTAHSVFFFKLQVTIGG